MDALTVDYQNMKSKLNELRHLIDRFENKIPIIATESKKEVEEQINGFKVDLIALESNLNGTQAKGKKPLSIIWNEIQKNLNGLFNSIKKALHRFE